MRSLFPKIGNFSLDMTERETDIGFLTEVWEKKENKKHQFKLEEMLEMKGVKYISTPRPGAQRGAGAAIAVRMEKFNFSKLKIPIPKSVEVVWGLLQTESHQWKNYCNNCLLKKKSCVIRAYNTDPPVLTQHIPSGRGNYIW